MSINKDNNILYNERFPLSNKYEPNWVLDNSMGPNALWLTEWLCETMDLKPDMRVLDLGCGRAISSVFLAKEFGVQVWAYDLWIKATDNWNRIKQQGLGNKIYPIHGDARNMPFAEGFFDAIISVDSYIYFGTDDLFLNYLQQFLVPGGTLAIVMPGLIKDFEDGVPEHLKDFWGQDCWSWHTVDWWKKLWERTRLVDIKVADTMPEDCKMYIRGCRRVCWILAFGLEYPPITLLSVIIIYTFTPSYKFKGYNNCTIYYQ